MPIVLDTATLKSSTKGLVGLAISVGGLLQIQQVHDFVFALAEHHPHIVTLLGMVMTVYTLLHNPQVEAILGIKKTFDFKTEEVSIIPNEVK